MIKMKDTMSKSIIKMFPGGLAAWYEWWRTKK